MKWTSILAIYTLFWVFSAFLVLPFGVRTHEEAGMAKVPGQAESAPANFSPKRIVFRATILALILFGLYYANYVEGWVTAASLDFFAPPPNADGSLPS
jgi:predicted secreted protein